MRVSCRGGSSSKNRQSPTGRRREPPVRACWPCPRWVWPRRVPGPVDCGPPPKAKPQSRTGGESFPPLPLPATPLRRTEKKRPPSPPSLVGKMALGPVRFVRKGDQRVQYRDWMTDPADLDSLLAWTNEKLGIHYGKAEADFEHFSFDPRELPALLFAGHNSFKLGRRRPRAAGPLRARRRHDHRRRLLRLERLQRRLPPRDPGDLPRPAPPQAHARRSAASRRTTSSATSPTRRPTARSTRTPPAWKASRVGCRMAVVYSPADLTCGWDGHDHPPRPAGRDRPVPADRRQLRHLPAGQLPARPVPEQHQGLPRGRRRQPRRFHLRPARARRRLGPRSLGRPQPAQARPRQLDAHHQVQEGERAAQGPQGHGLPACST